MIKHFIFFIFTLSFSLGGVAQSGNNSNLYISFGKNYKFNSTDYLSELIKIDPRFQDLSNQYEFTLVSGISIGEEALSRMEKSAIALTGSSSNVDKLRQLVKVVFANPPGDKIKELAQKLRQISIVEYCSVTSAHPLRPPSDILPVTSNLEPSQTYIEANPGVNMRYAWNMGVNGAGIKIRDIEYGFNKQHEDLIDKNVSIAQGMTISPDADEDYTDHGTYALGIVYADKGTYGVSGLAYGANEVLLFPEWQESGYDRIFAVSEAIENSVAGDVLIYEMQELGQNDNYVPAEFEPVLWDMTKAATDSGLVIVAAAGNGGENLNAVFYNEYTGRGDSGAIIIGAGTPNTSHNRMSFSTYGSRVDLQGWGDSVLTTGYYYDVNRIIFGSDPNQSYDRFSGTSSAVAMVGACVAVLQSYYKSMSGNNLTSQQLRAILTQSGTAQGTATSSQHIGPLPNMQAAINKVNTDYLSDEEYLSNSVVVYPNPAKDVIRLTPSTNVSNNPITADLYAIDGKIILKNIPLDADPSINISNLHNGIYILALTLESNNKIYKKIIKE